MMQALTLLLSDLRLEKVDRCLFCQVLIGLLQHHGLFSSQDASLKTILLLGICNSTAENLVNNKKFTNYVCKDRILHVTRFTFLLVPSSASYSP